MNDISPKKTPLFRRQIPRTLLIGAGIVAGAVFLAFVGWRIWIRVEISQEVAAIRAEKLPANWKELSKWIDNVPDSENAALIYLKAAGEIRGGNFLALKRYEKDAMPRSGPLSDEMRGVMVAIIKTNEAALAEIYRAAQLPKSFYPVDYPRDYPGARAALEDHVFGLRDIGFLMAGEALFKTEEGDYDGAAKSISAGMTAAHSLDTSTSMQMQYASFHMTAILIESLQRVLNQGPVSEELLAKLGEQLTSEEKSQRFLTAMICERARNNDLLEFGPRHMKQFNAALRSENDDGGELIPSQWGMILRILGFFDRDRLFFLRAMKTNITIARMTPPASLAMSHVREEIGERAGNGLYIGSGMILPEIALWPESDAEMHARLRTASTAAGIERWRAMHDGKLPESLAALVPSLLPEVPQDPFDGQPLRYKSLPRGYVVYSIGRDMKDDGGKEQPLRSAKIPLAEKNSFDITFVVER